MLVDVCDLDRNAFRGICGGRESPLQILMSGLVAVTQIEREYQFEQTALAKVLCPRSPSWTSEDQTALHVDQIASPGRRTSIKRYVARKETWLQRPNLCDRVQNFLGRPKD